ncbi:alpha/beta hydrolase [Oxalobacter sp. OttesenSCG-928-P03]|nr:alpha/beta hydrolase [Oxalobacter sp. OttesenSCG-928-P03]
MYSDFYFPDRQNYDSPHRLGLAYQEVAFESADGTMLWGWFIPARNSVTPADAKGTVIHMHGNAQNLTAHWGFAEWVPDRGFNLFVFDYRGFGKSQGVPEPQGIFEDAVAAINYVRNRKDIDTGRLFIFGQSLGGMLAIASAAASPEGIRAVLAEAPAHSYSMWMNDRLPGAGDILDDTCTAGAYIARLSPIPLLLLHGTRDRVVDYSHSARLLAEASDPVELVTIEHGEHVDAMTDRHGRRYQDMMITFFENALKKD